MLENKEERAKKKAARRGTASEQNPRGTDDIAIPDYVMRDFGSPEEQGHIEDEHLERALERLDGP